MKFRNQWVLKKRNLMLPNIMSLFVLGFYFWGRSHFIFCITFYNTKLCPESPQPIIQLSDCKIGKLRKSHCHFRQCKLYYCCILTFPKWSMQHANKLHSLVACKKYPDGLLEKSQLEAQRQEAATGITRRQTFRGSRKGKYHPSSSAKRVPEPEYVEEC